MKQILETDVPGKPIAQGSMKSYGGRRIVHSNARELTQWRQAVAWTLRTQYRGEPLDEPIAVHAVFRLQRPKTVKREYPTTPPDLDKLQRAIGDAITESGIVKDDSRIIEWRTVKRYVEWETAPGVAIYIYTMAEEDSNEQ